MKSKIIQDSEKMVIKRIDEAEGKNHTTSSIQITKDNITIQTNKCHLDF